MKHVQTFENFIYEGLSKINPGKRLIQSSLAGAPSASKYVETAKEALATWIKIAEEISKARADKDKAKIKELGEKKKEVLAKLLALKKQAKEKVGAEMKDIPAEKKSAAKEKAEEVTKQFTDAIKKREQKAENVENGKGEEKEKVDTEKIKSEMKKIKDEMTQKEDDFYKQQDEEQEAWYKKMEDKGYNDSDWLGDKGWNEATEMYDDFQNEKSKKENDFYKTLQALADKYTALEKQLDDAEGKNESYVWESIVRILEFDAQAMADKAKEKAEKTEDKIDDLEAKKDDDKGDDEEEGNDDDKIEAEIEKLEKEWEKRKDELLDKMHKAEQDGDDGPGGAKDKAQEAYAEEEEAFKKKKEELEDKLSTPESVKYVHTFESFLNEGFRRPDKLVKIADPYKTSVEQYLDDRDSKKLNRIIVTQSYLRKDYELFLNGVDRVNNMIKALKGLDKSKDAYEVEVDDMNKIIKDAAEKDAIYITWTKFNPYGHVIRIQLNDIDALVKALEKLVKL